MARYFVHLPSDGSAPIYWRPSSTFSTPAVSTPAVRIQYNLSLLALVRGDDPVSLLPAGATLVAEEDYEFGDGTADIVRVQPFVCTTSSGDTEELPIGPNLRAFLDDPLEGEKMALSLPFYDEEVKLGPRGGGFFRRNDDTTGFHGATDFNKSPREVFDACAAADGKVIGRNPANADAGASMMLSHTTFGGKEFLTFYQHLDITTAPPELVHGADVRRGQFLGRTIDVPVPDVDHVVHLHFGVAVSSPAVTLNGVNVPELWYWIDPWGVYDYYNHDRSTYTTYLPPDSQPRIFESPVLGVTHTPQWLTEPLFKTIPIARRTDGFQQIVRVQVRARRGGNAGGTLPVEHEQFLVWLEDEPGFFFMPLTQATDRTMELELITLLREAYFHGKAVQLEYRYEGDLRYIMAAWVGD